MEDENVKGENIKCLLSSSDSSFSSTFSSFFSSAAAPPAAAPEEAAAEAPPEGTEASFEEPSAMSSSMFLPFNSEMSFSRRS